MALKLKKYGECLTLARRCLLLSLRNPDIVLSSILLPALLMFLFVALFGKLVHVEGLSYVNYIVPGVLLQCIGQCASSTAIGMNRDRTGGIISRFRSLPIDADAILRGRVLESVLRNILSSVIVLLVALPLGFRPAAGLFDWLIVLLLLLGISAVISWLSIYIGLRAKSAEGASVLSAVAVVLPYLSSGFVPTASMPRLLALFAEYQPMTPIIDSMRSAFLGLPLDPRAFWAAVLCCLALRFLFLHLSRRAFRRA